MQDRRISLKATSWARNVHRSWVCSVERDLFGEIVVSVTFGRTGAEGRTIRYAMTDEQAALALTRRALKRRARAELRCGARYRVVEAVGFEDLPPGLTA